MVSLPNRRAALLALGSAVAVVALQSFGQTTDPDLWWHLKAGQLALQSPSLLATDPFSFTFAARPWAYKDLIAEIFLYGGFRLIGFSWFLILKLLVGILVYFQLKRIARGSAVVALVFTTAFLATVPLIERPDLFSLAMAATLLAHLDASVSRRAAARYVVITALIQWAWCTLHRACMVGFLIQGIFALTMSVKSRDRRWLFAVWGGLAASLATSLLTVNGLALWRTSLGALHNATIHATISEWQPLTLGQYLRQFPFSAVQVLFAICAIVAVAVVARRARREAPAQSLFYLILIATLFILGLRSARWVTFLTLASSAAACALAGWTLRNSAPRSYPRGSLLLVALALPALIFVKRGDRPFTLGADPKLQPEQSLAFAERHGLSGNAGNAFDLGGYVIWRSWPAVKVLVDGRNELVYPEDFMATVVRSESDPAIFEQLHASHHFSWVLATNRPGHESHRFLARHPAWAAVHWSDAAVLYVERASLPPSLTPYRELNPLGMIPSIENVLRSGDGARLETLARELERLVVENPDSVRALVALFVFHDGFGASHRAQRDAVLETLERSAPTHPAVLQIRQRLRERAARPSG